MQSYLYALFVRFNENNLEQMINFKVYNRTNK
jgi:hypothetical protein